MDKFFYALIRWFSAPAFYVAYIWKTKALRSAVLAFAFLSLSIISIFSLQAYITVMSWAVRMVFAMMFMVVQFAALFWILSRTKVIETDPGDPGEVTFDDYYGNDHLVSLVKEWTGLLTDGRGKLEDMGGQALSGFLLIGPPGTGKTLLARALSGSAKSAFIGMSGSDFTSMFLGVGVLKVRGMFSKARKKAQEYGSCILFIDEIDAIAGNRGGVAGDPRNNPIAGGMAGGMFGGMGGLGVMSRLLVEMDGVQEIPLRTKIENRMRKFLGYPPHDPGTLLIMAATNRGGALDPAITRPGRLDRTIYVDLPDRHSRRAIIEGYLNKIKHNGDIDVDYLVTITTNMSPAFLASAITKDACRIAIQDERREVTQQDIEDAIQENILGLANPISDLDPEQRKQVAIHEAGHAVAMYHLVKEIRMARVSIVRRGGALGYVLPVEKTEIYAMPLDRFVRQIMVSLAGHVAVELKLGKAWTGASSDLNKVRAYTYSLAAHGYFGEFPMTLDPMQNTDVRERVEEFLRDAHRKTLKFLARHETELDALTQELLDKDDLTGAQATELLDGYNDVHSSQGDSSILADSVPDDSGSWDHTDQGTASE